MAAAAIPAQADEVIRLKHRFITLTAVIIVGICLLAGMPFARAQGKHPITMSVETDPSLALSDTGTITYLRFTLTNTSATPYVLHHATLSCAALNVAQLLDDEISVPARGTKEIMLYNVGINGYQLGNELTFTLEWQQANYTGDDVNHVNPMYEDHSEDALITIQKFEEPVLSLSVAAPADKVKSGEQVTVVYTLTNPTKFDMTSLSLYDVGTLNALIPLPSTAVTAGETVTVSYTFQMGDTDVSLRPKATYNVRGALKETVLETPVGIENVIVSLDMTVQTFPATADGTLFSIQITNSGTHTMSAITVLDEINTEVAKPFSLDAGQSKTLSYTVSVGVASVDPRRVSFSLSATDCFLDPYSYSDPNTYEVLPYVTSDQINLGLKATLTKTYLNDNGVLYGVVAFEIRNDSAVNIVNASLHETLVYTASALITYDMLSQGITTFSQEFAVADLDALSFVLVAHDAGGSEYTSATVTLDLSSLGDAATATNEPQLVDPDVIGSGLDVEKYFRAIFKALVIVVIVVAVCIVVIYALFAAEKRERSKLPLDDNGLDSAFDSTEDDDKNLGYRTGRLEPLPAAEQTAQYGYVAPAKLRYIDKQQPGQPGYAPIPTASNPNGVVQSAAAARKNPDPQGETKAFARPIETNNHQKPDTTARYSASARSARVTASRMEAAIAADALYPRAIASAPSCERRPLVWNPIVRVQGQSSSR